MGQYHTIYNKTKKEYIRLGGAKLWEQAHSGTSAMLLLLLCNSNGRGGGDFNVYPENWECRTDQDYLDQAVMDNVSGRWAGDSIVVQGDYAGDDDKAFIPENELDKYVNITRQVCDALLIAENGDKSDIAEIIESETSMEYGSLHGKPSAVKKVKAKNRNKQLVELYEAKGFTKTKVFPVRKTKKKK